MHCFRCGKEGEGEIEDVRFYHGTDIRIVHTCLDHKNEIMGKSWYDISGLVHPADIIPAVSSGNASVPTAESTWGVTQHSIPSGSLTPIQSSGNSNVPRSESTFFGPLGFSAGVPAPIQASGIADVPVGESTGSEYQGAPYAITSQSIFPTNVDYIVYPAGGLYCAFNPATGVTTSNPLLSVLAKTFNGFTTAFRSGIYVVDAQLNFNKPTSFLGAGRDKTVFVRNIPGNVVVGILFAGNNIVCRDLTFDGGFLSGVGLQTAGQEEAAWTGTNVMVQNVGVRNFYANGMGTSTSGLVYWNNCVISGLSGSSYGIYNGDRGGTAFITNCTIRDCGQQTAVIGGGYTSIEHCYLAGNAIAFGGQLVSTLGTIFFQAKDNYIDTGGSGASGIEVNPGNSSGANYNIIGNMIANQKQFGIVSNLFASGFKSLIIKGNTIKNVGINGVSNQNGIRIGGQNSNFVIDGNIIFDDANGQGITTSGSTTTIDCIHIGSGCQNFSVTNNICYGASGFGILVESGCNSFIIAGNIAHDNTTGQIRNNSSGTNISGIVINNLGPLS